MTTAEAITAIRTATRYDVVTPSPVDNAQVTVWLDQEHKRFRRQLNVTAPQLYMTATGTTAITAGNQSLAKPADFERLIRIERLETAVWVTVEASDDTNLETQCFLGFSEQGANFIISPLVSAPGSYRIVYSKTVAAGYTTLEVPDGLEDVIVERVCARVKERLEPETAAIHFQIADRIWNEQLPLLKLRYGRVNRSGFRESYKRWV